ncbi:hypothetical protein GF336_01480 [Candidatus Woesearchaeota archaeon]|nr:hypothetical protein [Candidatus Woesearchaeota archaeon]
MKTRQILIGICILLMIAPFADAACTVEGYVYNIGGSPVPESTPVNVTIDAGAGNVSAIVYTEAVAYVPGYYEYTYPNTCTTYSAWVYSWNSTHEGYNMTISGSGTTNLNIFLDSSKSIDTIPPSINLESPLNNSNWTSSYDVVFKFNTTDENGTVSACSLYINSSLNKTKSSIIENTTQNITSNLKNGDYLWKINCTDDSGNSNVSEERLLHVAVPNSPPSFTTTVEDGSDSSNPTNNNSYVQFDAIASDTEGDQWHIVVCDTEGISQSGVCTGTMLCNDTTPADPGQPSSCQHTVSGEAAETNDWYAYACDSQNCSSYSNSTSPYHVNHPPSIAAPTITGAYNSVSIINCTPGAASDPDTSDSPQPHLYKWFINSSEVAGQTSSSLNCTSISECKKGAKISCSGNVIDTHGYQGEYSAKSSNTTIQNSKPSSPEIDVSPDTPSVEDNIYCNITSAASDPDNDPLNYTYRWYKDSVLAFVFGPIPDFSTYISSGNTTSEETWTCNVSATDGSLNSSESSAFAVVNDTIPPVIHEVIIMPYTKMITLNQSINFTLNATDNVQIDSNYLNISFPNGTVVQLTVPVNYTAPVEGLYNYTLFVNDTSGNPASEKGYFIVGKTIIMQQYNLVNESGASVGTVGVYYQGKFLHNHSLPNGSLADPHISDFLLDYRYTPEGGIAVITLNDINVTIDNNQTLLYQEISPPSSGFLSTIVVNSTYSTSPSAKLIYSYSGISVTDEDYLEVYKCDDWNFTSNNCSGTWKDITSNSTQDKSEDYFEIIVSSFSGFSIRQASAPPSPKQPSGGGGGSSRRIDTPVNISDIAVPVYPEMTGKRSISLRIIESPEETSIEDSSFIVFAEVKNTGTLDLKDVRLIPDSSGIWPAETSYLGDLVPGEKKTIRLEFKNNVCSSDYIMISSSLDIRLSAASEKAETTARTSIDIDIPELSVITDKDSYSEKERMRLCLIYNNLDEQEKEKLEFEIDVMHQDSDYIIDYLSPYSVDSNKILLVIRDYALEDIFYTGYYDIYAKLFKEGRLFSDTYLSAEKQKKIYLEGSAEIKLLQAKNTVYSMRHDSRDYSIFIEGFDDSFAHISLLSRRYNIRLLESKIFDIDDDSIEDISITYLGEKNSKADLRLRKLPQAVHPVIESTSSYQLSPGEKAPVLEKPKGPAGSIFVFSLMKTIIIFLLFVLLSTVLIRGIFPGSGYSASKKIKNIVRKTRSNNYVRKFLNRLKNRRYKA